MLKQLVEVIDRHGHVVHGTIVELEHEDGVDAKYEEVALRGGAARDVSMPFLCFTTTKQRTGTEPGTA